MINYPCKCGHLWLEHCNRCLESNGLPTNECTFGMVDGLLCDCIKFKQDNLKYLEMKYEEKLIK